MICVYMDKGWKGYMRDRSRFHSIVCRSRRDAVDHTYRGRAHRVICCDMEEELKISRLELATKTFAERDYFLSELHKNYKNPQDTIKTWEHRLLSNRAATTREEIEKKAKNFFGFMDGEPDLITYDRAISFTLSCVKGHFMF